MIIAEANAFSDKDQRAADWFDLLVKDMAQQSHDEPNKSLPNNTQLLFLALHALTATKIIYVSLVYE